MALTNRAPYRWGLVLRFPVPPGGAGKRRMESFWGMGVGGKETLLQKGPFPQRSHFHKLTSPLFSPPVNIIQKSAPICFLVGLAVVFACVHGRSSADGRTCVHARNGMVVSDHKLASQVGVDVLKKGGNAIDAAVATAFALAVTLPSAGNIGGGGFLVYHGADGTVTAFDFREKAPIAATKTMFLGDDGKIRDNSNHEGLLSVGVPGTVAGLLLAHERFGSTPLAELIQPAIALADRGFPVSKNLHSDMKKLAPEFSRYPSSANVFLKNGGEPYEPGEIWRQPDLAATLRRIQKHGRGGFYTGRTARLFVKMMKENGGIITLGDLAAYRAVERKAIHGTYRGYDIYAMCPPSSGGVVLAEMLNILEGFDLRNIEHNSALYMHILTEAMRRAYADRARYLGDPDFNADMPIERLVSKEHANKLRSTIDMERASASDVEGFNVVHSTTETTHISVVDTQRNAVSLTYTLEQAYGSKIVVAGAGFLLNNEMGDFNPIPGYTDTTGLIGTPPNLIAPQKRMLSSMTPTIVAKDGRPVLVIGTPGGRTIINTVLQVILNVIDHEMDIAEAIEAARFHHQWLPDVTSIEKRGITANLQALYERFGHEVELVAPQGRAMGIFIDHEAGGLEGAADSRSPDGAAVGY